MQIIFWDVCILQRLLEPSGMQCKGKHCGPTIQTGGSHPSEARLSTKATVACRTWRTAAATEPVLEAAMEAGSCCQDAARQAATYLPCASLSCCTS